MVVSQDHLSASVGPFSGSEGWVKLFYLVFLPSQSEVDPEASIGVKHWKMAIRLKVVHEEVDRLEILEMLADLDSYLFVLALDAELIVHVAKHSACSRVYG